MRKILMITLVLMAILVFPSFQSKFHGTQPAKAKYVFLLIGDGMGINQVYLANEYQKQIGGQELSILSLPHFGLMTTSTVDPGVITDSGAGGTAIACGEKTKSGVIGMDSSKTRNLVSVAEVMQNKKYPIGIITSVGINHATPASFFGHRAHRGMYDDLVKDMTASGFEYFAGGGVITNNKLNPDSARKVLINDIVTSGYTLVANQNQKALIKNAAKVFVCDTSVYGTSDALYNVMDPKKAQFTLSEMLQMGIDKLFNKNGFFFMLEGGKIDWSSHSNDAMAMIHEVIDFDNAIKVALDFYKKYPNETLIIITADHETGGLGWGYRETKYYNYSYKLAQQKLSVDALIDSLKTKDAQESKVFVKNYTGIELPEEVLSKGDYAYSAAFAVDAINKMAGIGWTTGSHTGTPVGVYAIGAGAEKFAKRIDNTDIKPFILQSLAK
jgi:alkaline phosphatase